jgi:hypothetical protein
MRVEDERMSRFAIADELEAPAPAAASPSAKHCGAGSAAIAIDPYGNIYPCVQWRRAVGTLHEQKVSDLWGHAFDGIRTEAEEAKRVVAAHPRGKQLNFCPGLAEVLTGSATKVPAEMERIATVVGG